MAQALEGGEPALALVDIDDAIGDPASLCRSLKNASTQSFFPIILLSDGSDPTRLCESYVAGAICTLHKPIESVVLLEQLRSLEALYLCVESQEASRERMEQIQRVAHVGVWEWSAAEKCLIWSSELSSILGIAEPTMESSFDFFLSRVHPSDRQWVEEAITQAIEEGTGFDLEHRIVRNGDQTRFVQHRAEFVDRASGDGAVLIGTLQDVTDRQSAEKRMLRLAHFDLLTGLPNRALSKDRLGLAIRDARRTGRIVALLVFNIDRFQRVNGMLSEAMGDLLLGKVAERLKCSVRDGDTVGKNLASESSYGVSRLGADEFTILLKDLASADAAAGVARRILHSLATPFVLDEHEIHLSASIGIAFYPNDGDTVEAIFKCATSALEAAKAQVGNSFQYFDDSMNELGERKLIIESGLHKAVARDEFSICYQPRYSASTQKICGIEALARWEHASIGAVPPSEFIAVAEETGLISAIGEWVLRSACAANKLWQDQGFIKIPVAVNLSSHQFRETDLVSVVECILRETELPPQFLELEITESIMMEDREIVARALARLRGLGIQIALDDFGTGYSSLSYVKDFPLDTIKIDRCFVRDLGERDGDGAIVKAIVAMAHSLGLRVVAEGVETPAQVRIVTEYGCDEIQGFFFSRPVPPGDLVRLFEDSRHRASKR